MERLAIQFPENLWPTPNDTRSCYLDMLPDDILQIVLRYLSRRPHHQNLHAYVSARAINTVLDVGGVLARAASLEFHSVGSEDGISFYADVDALISCPLLHRLTLHRLVLELCVDGVLPDLLRGCGAELRELVLNTKSSVLTQNDILAISAHCMKLSSLTIRAHQVEGTLRPIWRSLGYVLTQIYIGSYNSDDGYGIRRIIAIPDLVERCVNLCRVDVQSLNDEIADALVALGCRIRVLGIEDQNIAQFALWHKVLRACTNLEAVHLCCVLDQEPVVDGRFVPACS